MSFCLIEWSYCIMYIRVMGGGALLSYNITLHYVTLRCMTLLYSTVDT